MKCSDLVREERLTEAEEMEDRFGPIPPQVEDLFTTVRCRRMSVALGFEKLFLKNGNLKCFFVSNPESPYFTSDIFNKMIDFLQKGTNKAKLKQTGKLFLLLVDDVKDMTALHDFLLKMHQFIF